MILKPVLVLLFYKHGVPKIIVDFVEIWDALFSKIGWEYLFICFWTIMFICSITKRAGF